MKLMIDIPEDVILNDTYTQYFGCMSKKLDEVLHSGLILPKGHGDLIDRRELKKEVYTTTEWNGDIHRIIYEASIDKAKPIIEADKENDTE